MVPRGASLSAAVRQIVAEITRGAPRKLYLHFFSNLMGHDRGDSCPFDFEPNGIPFGSHSI